VSRTATNRRKFGVAKNRVALVMPDLVVSKPTKTQRSEYRAHTPSAQNFPDIFLVAGIILHCTEIPPFRDLNLIPFRSSSPKLPVDGKSPGI
jgi:hypothetical protein